MVVEAAERNDDIFPGCSFRQFAFQHNLNRPRNLPPEFTGGPGGSGISAHYRRANCAESAVHVGVRVGSDHK